MRWKPTVMPAAVTKYMTARIARSCQLTTRFQKQDDRGERGQEGNHHAAEVGDLRRSSHGVGHAPD